MTREEWLLSASQYMVAQAGYSLPPRLQVSVGFPPGGRRPSVLGYTCWSEGDNTPHVFVSPEVAESHLALSTLTHELVHALLPKGTGHGPRFGVVAASFGLLPPWETTPTHTTATDDHFATYTAEHGEYPSQEFQAPAAKPGRMPKWSCDCKIVYATSAKADLHLFCEDCGQSMKRAAVFTEESEPIAS